METKSAVSIDCPRCPARAGEPCRDRSLKVRTPHSARVRRADPEKYDPYLAAAATSSTTTTVARPPVRSTQPTKPSRPAINTHPFTCSRCGAWSAAHTTKIVKDRNEWVHERCCNDTAGAIRAAVGAAIDPDHCATCGGGIHSGNRMVNDFGELVHKNGCPTSRNRNRSRHQGIFR